jgi:hypothetical protein
MVYEPKIFRNDSGTETPMKLIEAKEYRALKSLVETQEEVISRQRNQITDLTEAIRETLEDNANLADGDDCTLIKLKKAIGLK